MPEREPDWSEIVQQHGTRVLRIAARILGSVHDAEDVAQDVFVEAYRLQKDGAVQSWAGLLVRLATLRAIDRLRRVRVTQPLAERVRSGDAGPLEVAVGSELAERLRDAVARLPEQQASVFTLVAFEHMARDDVATSLSISPQAVSTALYKARQRLMAELSVCQPEQQ